MGILTLLSDGDTFNPRRLLIGSTVGAIYSFDDFAYLYQKSDGSAPVTALEQPVGLVVDQRYGGNTGADQRSAGAAGVVGSATAATFNTSTGAGSVTRVDSGNQSFVTFSGLATAGWYRYTLSVSAGTIVVRSGASGGTIWSTVSSASGTVTLLVPASSGNITISANGVGTATFTVSSLRELPGLHAYQATDAARPVLSARYNLFTATQGNFNAAQWATSDVTVTDNVATAPDGTATASLATEGSTGSTAFRSTTVTTNSATMTTRFSLKRGNTDWVRVRLLDGSGSNGGNFWINLATGAKGSSAAVGTGTGLSFDVVSQGSGWYAVTFSANTGASNCVINIMSASSDGGTGRVNGATYYLWGADLRLTADANSRLPAYQRVTTATDYDSAGFKRFDLSDRTDDHFSVASGGGSTTGFLLCAAIQPTGAGTARTIFSDRGTNTGYKVEIDASNNLLFTAGNGAAFTTCTGPALTAGTPYVITCWHDGTNLNIRVNRGATTSQAFATATAGTTGFTIGKDNGAASGYYSGRRFALTYIKDSTVPASALDSLIAWTAAKGGIAL